MPLVTLMLFNAKPLCARINLVVWCLVLDKRVSRVVLVLVGWTLLAS
jgi:hypothetical protein